MDELETNLATTMNDMERVCPGGIVLDTELITCNAWDNYDEITETLSGSGGVHDTVGICIQSKAMDQQQNVPKQDNTAEKCTISQRSKRT